jgi:hypothetical protein
MREIYETKTASPRTKVSTTSVAANWPSLFQALASSTGSISLEINAGLRKMA